MGAHRYRCFNPRPHMGGDQTTEWLKQFNAVSIHAPTWGATKQHIEKILKVKFQSTPPHGGRRHKDLDILFLSCFNPRPHMGGDGRLHLFLVDGAEVSIHAPTWGATLLRRSSTVDRVAFQSTPPHGGRPPAPPEPTEEDLFQSTPPHGGRPARRRSFRASN